VNATAVLLNNVNKRRVVGVARSSQTMAAKTMAVMAILTSPNRRNRRLSKMSARAPAGMANRNIGKVDAAWTRATITGSGLRLVISQADAALDIQPPVLDATVAIQTMLNRR
jgi:hypothetical protein